MDMKWKDCKCGNPDLGLLVARLVLAAVFIAHGWAKFQDMEGTVNYFNSLNLPAVLAYLVALGELFGGVSMLLGFATHWAGKVLAVIMVGAILIAKPTMGLIGGYELDLSLLALVFAIVMIGPGKYTLRSIIKRDR